MSQNSWEWADLAVVEYQREQPTTYATYLSGVSPYAFAKVIEGSGRAAKSRDHIPNMVMKQSLFAHEQDIIGRRRNKAELKFYNQGTSVALDKTATPRPTYLTDFYEITLGGQYYSSGSGIVSATSSGSFTVDTGTATRFKVGGGLSVTNPSSSWTEVRTIKSKSGDTITLDECLTWVPSSGTLVYNAHSIYPTNDPSASLQLHVRGRTLVDSWVLCGQQLASLGLDFPFGQPSVSTFNEEGTFWQTGSAGVSGEIYDVQITDGAAPTFDSNFISIYPTGSTAVPGSPTTLAVESIKITPGFKFEDIMGAGRDNVVRKRTTRVVAATVEIVLPESSLQYFTGRDAKTNYGIRLQVGNTPGNCFTVAMRNCQLIEVDDQKGTMGVYGNTLKFQCLTSQDVNNWDAGFLYLGLSPFTIIQS